MKHLFSRQKTMKVLDYCIKKAALHRAPPSNQTIGFSLAAPLLDHLVLQARFLFFLLVLP